MEAGLCAECSYARIVRSDRGAVFYRCQRALSDENYPKYPKLPVLKCPGYESFQQSRVDDARGQR